MHYRSVVILALILLALLMLGLARISSPGTAWAQFETNTPEDRGQLDETALAAPEVTPDMILVPVRTSSPDSAPVIVNLPDLRGGEEPTVIINLPQAEESGDLTTEQIALIGLFIIIAVLLWVLNRSNLSLATLVPLPFAQEMIKSGVRAGIEEARRAAAATPTRIDDELVDYIEARLAQFFKAGGDDGHG